MNQKPGMSPQVWVGVGWVLFLYGLIALAFWIKKGMFLSSWIKAWRWV